MAASASPISAAMNPAPSGARKETASAAMASTSAAMSRTRPLLMPAMPAGAATGCAPSAGLPAASFNGSGLKPALRMASSAPGKAPSSAVMAIVRSPSRKRSPRTPATGSSARRISDSSTAQSIVGMRKSKAPLGMSAAATATAGEPQAGLPQQAVSAAAGAWG
ncbi:hypothetical protein D9M68_794960 [compost metagenome]